MIRGPGLAGLAAVLMALAMWALPALAEEVYVSNKPFKGPVAGKGADLYVGLEALAKALGVEVQESAGSWFVGCAPEEAKDAPKGSVVAAGKVVPSQPGPGGATMVRLKDTAEALGAVVRYNKQMGTVDVNKPVAKMTPATPREAAAAAPAGPLPPIYVNKDKPGAAMDVKRVVVEGRKNIVYFYADW